MRVPGLWSLLFAASFTPGLASAEPAAASAAAAPPPEPAPPSPPEPAPAAPPSAAGEATQSPSTTEAKAASETAATVAAGNTAPAQVRAEQTTPVGATPVPSDVEPATNFSRDFAALPLTLEARFGINARLASSFDQAADEEHWGASYAFASYFSWRPEFALGLELDNSGLGRVRALSGQSSVDNEYTATGAWLGARVFPIRSRRLDFFLNLRVGMVFQHVDALGTRAATSITEPAQSFSCNDWDEPRIGLGGALGLAYRLSRHFAFVSRVDLNGERLNGGSLGACAGGIGSVATLGGSVGLAFEFETAPK
jgi:hypothetical protein